MESLLKKIKLDADQKTDAVRKASIEEERRILEEAETEAQAEAKRAIEAARKRAELESARIASSASLEAKKSLAACRDAILEKWIADAAGKLDELRSEKQYSKSLAALVNRAVSEIPSQSIAIEAAKGDEKEIRAIAGKRKNVSVKAAPSVKAGAIVRAGDGSIEIDATFERLLETRKPAIKKELSALLEAEK